VTIAAGFVTRDGILLCSDSQYSGWEKIYDAKLFSRAWGSGTVSFAFSGSVDHARSIIEDCWEKLAMPSGPQNVADLRRDLREVIKIGISQCPAGTELPEFLIGVTTQSEAHLFVARNLAMPRVSRFEFLGSGAYIAHHVVKSLNPAQFDLMSFEEGVLVALSVLSAAKRNDQYCGGGSQFLAAGRGAGLLFGPSSVDLSDALLDRYEFLLRNLFISVGDRHCTDEGFAKTLNDVCSELTTLRKQMREPSYMLASVLDSISQVAKEARRLSTPHGRPPKAS
jgi:hypothetical protein